MKRGFVMAYREIGEFLSQFNISSYNRAQIGNDKSLLIKIYDFLKRLNISKEDTELLINNISYLRKEDVNIPLFLEILSRSLGYVEEYTLSTIIKSVIKVHNIYKNEIPEIPLEEYIHLVETDRIRKLFLTKNIDVKTYNVDYISDLKFAAAIILQQKEYSDFVSYIETNNNTQTLVGFTTYIKLRKKLDKEPRLYWDLYFGNEYLILLNKINIPFDEIFKERLYRKKKKEQIDPIQLDLFTYEEVEKEELKLQEYALFQINSIYDCNDIPYLENEKELIKYYNNLLEGKEYVVLPKYKGYSNNKYIFNTK